jgi:hypothetical protein
MSLLFYTLSLSLLDSVTTTQQIVVFALLLSTARPQRNALCYLAGLSGAYAACGIAGYFAIDELRDFLGRLFPNSSSLPNPVYYQGEFTMGLALIAAGVWFYRRKKKPERGRAKNFILSRLQSMNGWFAGGLGIFISVTSFPMSPPYLIALSKYSMLHLGLPAAVGYILLYNLGYASPMLLIEALYLAARRKADGSHERLHEKTSRLNTHLTAWTLVGFGFFSLVDAGCYFLWGHALIKGRYF